MDPLIEGYRRFREETWPAQRARFETLAAEGQRPPTMIIACSDSRVDPQMIFSADDQIVPYEDSGPLSAALLQHGTLKTYAGFPHGMPTTEAATINADLLAFLRA
jgi:hypothetical protein